MPFACSRSLGRTSGRSATGGTMVVAMTAYYGNSQLMQ